MSDSALVGERDEVTASKSRYRLLSERSIGLFVPNYSVIYAGTFTKSSFRTLSGFGNLTPQDGQNRTLSA